MMNKWLNLIVLLFSPKLALACSVCFTGMENQRDAYYYTTILLSLVPLMAIFGTFFWLRRKYKQGASLTLTPNGIIGQSDEVLPQSDKTND